MAIGDMCHIFLVKGNSEYLIIIINVHYKIWRIWSAAEWLQSVKRSLSTLKSILYPLYSAINDFPRSKTLQSNAQIILKTLGNFINYTMYHNSAFPV